MVKELIARRAAAADAHEVVRARFPHTAYTSPELRVALDPIAAELGAIAREMTAADGAPPGEVARSWMWYGDVLFDLAQGGHLPFARAIDAYRQAEPYVIVAKDRVLAAKRDGNLANILLRTPKRRSVLREIVARYDNAIATLGKAGEVFLEERANAVRILAWLDEFDRGLASRCSEAQEFLSRITAADLAPSVATALTECAAQLVAVQSIDSADEALAILQTVQDTLPRMMRLLEQSRVATPATRQGELARRAMTLWQDLAAEALSPLDAQLRAEMLAVANGLLACATTLRAADAANAVAIERDRLRGLAGAARRLLAHGHVTWIEPRWSTPLAVPTTSSVHIAGAPAHHQQLLADLCDQRALAIEAISDGPDIAEQRFNSIRRAAVTVIDLAGTPAACAAACYEAGIALALGKPLVVITGDTPMPFDIDVEPVRVDDRHALGDALDRALFSRQRVATTAPLTDLAAAARARFPDERYLVDSMDEHRDEPLTVASSLQTVLEVFRQHAQGNAIVAYPTWRRRYPGHESRLFHVMPFRAPWSNDVKVAAKRACGPLATYRRHDDVTDPQILRSLWDELTSATHFLVDLTGLNLNVVLELGVIDTLGAPALLVGQPGTLQSLFPMIRRVRIVEYASPDALTEPCRAFLSGSTGTCGTLRR